MSYCPPGGEMSVLAVRSMQICQTCGKPGWDLIDWMRSTPYPQGTFLAHGRCLVKAHGLRALYRLPQSELGKLTLEDVSPRQMRAVIRRLEKSHATR